MAEYFRDMLEERKHSSGRPRTAIPRVAHTAIFDPNVLYGNIVIGIEIPETVDGPEPEITYTGCYRSPRTGIIIQESSDTQCQLCGWYFARGRAIEDIRHYSLCPLYNDNGVYE